MWQGLLRASYMNVRFIKNCYTREPGTVTNLLNELNWIPLKERRTISRLTLFHKAIHGDGGLAFPDYVTKRRRHLRNSSQNKFIELLPNTETYKNSYFCRTVKDWNALPSKIVNIKSADRFKKVLFEYFSQWWILILHNDWCCEINYFNYYWRWNNNNMILIWGGLGKKIRVPDGIWTHDPPWSSRML